MEFFSFPLTWDPMGAKISKRYSSYRLQPKAFKLFLNFLPYGPHETTFGIFEILSFRFLTNIFRKFQIHHCILWRSQKCQLSGKRAIVEQNGVKFGTQEYFRLYTCNFWNLQLQLPLAILKIGRYLGNRCP